MWRLALGIVVAALVVTQAEAQQRRDSGWITAQGGCRVWDPVPEPNESVSWSGACVNGLASGVGVLQWYASGKPTDRYEGEFQQGHESGHGIVVSAHGNRYDGEWKGGRRNGYGVYVWANGDRYEGAWKDDRAHGEGTYREADGNVYPGNWVRGCLRDGNRRAWVGADSSACK